MVYFEDTFPLIIFTNKIYIHNTTVTIHSEYFSLLARERYELAASACMDERKRILTSQTTMATNICRQLHYLVASLGVR